MAEKRLIDANALVEKVKGLCKDSFAFRCSQHSREFAKDVADAVKNAPTVDAVEVVRCKDCRWFDTLGCAVYIVDDSDEPKENDFCSYGERRTDG